MKRRPSRNVNLLALRICVVFQQRLDVFPARESADASNVRIHDTAKTITGRVTKDSSLHMRGLDFLSGHEDLPVGVNSRLRDIQTIVDILREAEHDDDFVRGGGGLDLGHLRGVELQRVAHVCCCHLWVNRAIPSGV